MNAYKYKMDYANYQTRAINIYVQIQIDRQIYVYIFFNTKFKQFAEGRKNIRYYITEMPNN